MNSGKYVQILCIRNASVNATNLKTKKKLETKWDFRILYVNFVDVELGGSRGPIQTRDPQQRKVSPEANWNAYFAILDS